VNGKHKGSIEHRFGGRSKIVVAQPSLKELPALSIQCFEQRHKECWGKCYPFEPQTNCGCVCHRETPGPQKED
jgi:hypothetical protein